MALERSWTPWADGAQIGMIQTPRAIARHSALMPDALISGHHFSISALW